MNYTAYYNKTRAITFIIASVVWVAFQYENNPEQITMNSVLPVGMILFCLPRLKRKHLIFDNGELTVRAAWGPKKTTHRYKNFKSFEIEKNRLYLKDGNKRVPITEGWAVNRQDWITLKELIEDKGNPLKG
jgi:hypothetical protein